MNIDAAPAEVSEAPARPAMSFLDQIKAKKMGGDNERPPMPFGGAAPVSFLDAIKARRKATEEA